MNNMQNLKIVEINEHNIEALVLLEFQIVKEVKTQCIRKLV